MKPMCCEGDACADPLDLAAQRLDAAAAELDRLCRPPAPLPDECSFGRAEAEFLAARAAYRRLVEDRLGADAEAVGRLLAF